ncbi:hypothetical protein KIPB_003451 [Kipferlia bialata]|uniref:Uncharacterized protein n=1 Tax=Kipferlia bialata TaxID=797122 RepID=A0A9K3GFR8_9EUKA|nr:hypothetical protein KIPB_003451 [Kipferlia bialata]|eukprot:g3451.t1
MGAVLPLLLPKHSRLLRAANRKRWIINGFPFILGPVVATFCLSQQALGIGCQEGGRDYCWIAFNAPAWYKFLAFYGWIFLFGVVTTVGVIYTIVIVNREARVRRMLSSHHADGVSLDRTRHDDIDGQETAREEGRMANRFKRMFILPIFSALIWTPPAVRRILQSTQPDRVENPIWPTVHMVCNWAYSIGLIVITALNTQVLRRLLCMGAPVPDRATVRQIRSHV